MILSFLTYKMQNELKLKSTVRMNLQRKRFILNLYRIGGEVKTWYAYNIR